MKPHWADWTYASVVALALLELAALLVFKTPHGFEEQVGWYLALLPASIFAAGISTARAQGISRARALPAE